MSSGIGNLPISASQINSVYGSQSLLTARGNVPPAFSEIDSDNPFWAFYKGFPNTGPVSYSSFAQTYTQDGNGVQFTAGQRVDSVATQYGYSSASSGAYNFGSLVGTTPLKFPDGAVCRSFYYDALNGKFIILRVTNSNDLTDSAFKSVRINSYKFNRDGAGVYLNGSLRTYQWNVTSSIIKNNVVYTPLFSTTE